VETINDGRGPSFELPPVSEVACGVQFEELEGWSTAYFGQFWDRIKSEYPKTEDHPPLPRIPTGAATTFQSQFSLLPPLRRVFFIDNSGNFVMQVQSNRFLHNWRKADDADVYPRFKTAFDRYSKAWHIFTRFLQDRNLATPKAEMFELTYINTIEADGAFFPRDTWDFLGFYEKSPSATAALDATGMAMQFIWPLEVENGTLVLDVKHGKRATTDRDVLLVELTARGALGPRSPDMDKWFSVGHTAIVNTFEKLTTERGHKLWRKRDE
jgi:uncharacterized protein (TIGR04255 family)